MTFEQAKTLIEWINQTDYYLNEWECSFVEGILDRRLSLSNKQGDVLNRIYAKATGGGRWEKRQII